MLEFRVIIAGRREFDDYEMLKRHVDHMLTNKKETHRIIIVSGHAKGADSLGEKYARESRFDLEIHLAQWRLYPKTAGFIRNEEMAKVSDALIAFWDKKSKGTAHMIDTAKKYKLQVSIKEYVPKPKNKKV